MAGGVTRRIRQRGAIIGRVLFCIALYVYLLVEHGFDFLAIALGACVVLQLGMRFAPWSRIRQEGDFLCLILFCIALAVYMIVKNGFDVATVAFYAAVVLYVGTYRAIQARHTVAITSGLVLCSVSLAVVSAILLARIGVYPLIVGMLALLWLVFFMPLVLMWWRSRRGQPL